MSDTTHNLRKCKRFREKFNLDFGPKNVLNPFSTNVSLLYPLKTSENLWFSDVFRGYGSGTLVENGLKRWLLKSATLLKVDSSYVSWNQRKKEFSTAKNTHTNFLLGIWHRWILLNKILAVIWADTPNTQTKSFLLASKCSQSCVFLFIFAKKTLKFCPECSVILIIFPLSFFLFLFMLSLMLFLVEIGNYWTWFSIWLFTW